MPVVLAIRDYSIRRGCRCDLSVGLAKVDVDEYTEIAARSPWEKLHVYVEHTIAAA